MPDVPVTTCRNCDEQFVDGLLGMTIGHFVTKLAEKYSALVAEDEELRGTEVRKPYSATQFGKHKGRFVIA